MKEYKQGYITKIMSLCIKLDLDISSKSLEHIKKSSINALKEYILQLENLLNKKEVKIKE